MDVNAYLKGLQELQNQNEKYLIIMGIFGLGLLIFHGLVLFVVSMSLTNFLKSAAKYLDTKAVLDLAQLEGKRFVDEKETQHNKSSSDESRFQPRA